MKAITITTEVKKPMQKVWECFTLPKHITQWNFASPDWACPNATNDLKPGGKFSWRMEAKDGSMGFDFSGTYSEIYPYRLLKYTIEDGREVSVKFEESNGTVIVTETFEPENQNDLERQRQGWQAILDNFKIYAEKVA
ncbi:MAG: SRPBCC family protein [Cyclobacteriaceae bacterium]|nr:SRPBCC family protein [Cyclobacteriaceae bacterium SS2]